MPKSLYRTAEELENSLFSGSTYKSASIFKGAPYEVQHLLLYHLPVPQASNMAIVFALVVKVYCGVWCHQLDEV